MNGSRSPSRHGLNALKARVKVRGLGAIDRRTAAARSLLAFRNALIRDLGGDEELSAQRAALVDVAARTKLFIDETDAWLLAQQGLVQRRHRTLLPVLKDRMLRADALARYLTQLGLERTATFADDLDGADEDGEAVVES